MTQQSEELLSPEEKRLLGVVKDDGCATDDYLKRTIWFVEWLTRDRPDWLWAKENSQKAERLAHAEHLLDRTSCREFLDLNEEYQE